MMYQIDQVSVVPSQTTRSTNMSATAQRPTTYSAAGAKSLRGLHAASEGPLLRALEGVRSVRSKDSVALWKRALDISLVVLSLPVILLVSVPLAIYIKIVSPGPIFFRQDRIGLGARKFTLFKFRSMHCGAETATHAKHLQELIGQQKPMEKLDHGDPRLIPLAKWIRASGLDELPQLLNVVRGEMSIVGPRPCVGYEFEQYEEWQKERFTTLPGLTGLWQVKGKNRTTFNQMIQMDIDYARHASLWLDLSIMIRTPIALLSQLAAARKARKQAGNKNSEVPQSAEVISKDKSNGSEHEKSAESRSDRMRVLGS